MKIGWILTVVFWRVTSELFRTVELAKEGGEEELYFVDVFAKKKYDTHLAILPWNT